MRVAAFCASLALAACSWAPSPAGLAEGLCGPLVTPIEVVAHCTVDPEAVDQGIELWNSSSSLPLFTARPDLWDTCSFGCLGVATLYMSQIGTGARADVALDVSPIGEVRACDVRIDETWPAAPEVIAHELGHCLGLGHSDDESSIMHSPTRPWALPLPAEVDAVLGGCGRER